ncbi:MAG TPA: glycosyltransferase [Stellaceae bacterium]|jgi:GT2 family glycosyltransferase/tetratricopeptide (TPR) repeat protein|nr:glycosyltransferase [Stellaceae bacterium]
MLAHRLARRGDRARDAGNYAVAVWLYRRALLLDHERVDTRVQLAHMLKELTLYGEAEAAYRQASAQSPSDGDIHRQLGHLLKLLGRRDAALDAYRTAQRLFDDGEAAAAELRDELRAWDQAPDEDGRAAILAGEKLIREGDRLRDARQFAAAAETYGDALNLLPARVDIRIQLGNMLKDSGRLAEAESTYRTALADANENADLHLQLGHVLKLQGRRAEALLAYRRATEIQPSLDAAGNELFEAGYAQSQQQFFDKRLAQGGVEALLAISDQVSSLQKAVARLAEALPDLSAQTAFPVAAYGRFREIFEVPPPPQNDGQRRFAVVLAARDVTLDVLYAQIAAISAQTYCNWQLCVTGSDPALRRMVERAAASDPRIAWVAIAAEEAAGVAERRAALVAVADWLILPAPGALLHRHALAWFAAVAGECDANAFVCDAETVSERGGISRRSDPQLRQTVDYDTLLEANPFGETIAVAHPAYEAADLPATGMLETARSALLLHLARCNAVGHIPLPLVALRRNDELALPPTASANRSHEAHFAAARAHLASIGLDRVVSIEPAARPGRPLSVVWQPNEPQRPIQVIVPTRDNVADARNFIDSLRQHAAIPDAFQVLVVDNGSRDPAALRVLGALAQRSWVRVVALEEPFNWSRLNNYAAAQTEAPLLLFANDDMLMLSDGWDRHLRGLLERDEIGAVGARLVYADDTVQHAGILLGWPSVDVHDGRYEPVVDAGPAQRWHVTRAAGAVTGAFLAVSRTLFAANGGFDEIDLPVGYGDIDFALKLRAGGRKILWTPHITLRHQESKTRGLDHLDPEKSARNTAERRVMEQRWGAALEIDPSVNPIWHTATLPFRLISAPPQARVWRHIRLCASRNPWLPERAPNAP